MSSRYTGPAGEHGSKPAILEWVNVKSGARASLRSRNTVVTLPGSGVSVDAVNLFPAFTLCLGCTAKVVEPIGGVTIGLSVGGIVNTGVRYGAITALGSTSVGANTNFFGATNTMPWGSQGIGLGGGFRETGVRLSAIGGAFNGTGKVSLTVFYLCFVPEGIVDPYVF